jgi:hypothetical protein
MTCIRPLVSWFSRAALASTFLLAAGCDAPSGDAFVDVEALDQALIPMEQLVALADMTVFQMEEGMTLAALVGDPDHADGSVVVSAFGEDGSAVFMPAAGLDAPVPEAGSEEEPASNREDDRQPPRGFRLLWADFTSGGLGLDGDLELAGNGVATADVEITLGGQTSRLTMTGFWIHDGGGADVSMTGSMVDGMGYAWTVHTDALRLERGCAVVSGGRWMAEAVSVDGTSNPLRFEVRYQEGCGGCTDLFVNDTPIGRSCVGGN